MAPRIALLSVFAIALHLASCSGGVRASEAVSDSKRGPTDEFEARWAYLESHTTSTISPTDWDGSMPDGPATHWHENGTKAGEGAYVDNLRHGPWTFWFASGQIRWQGSYDLGVLDGLERSWHANGQPASQGTYARNQRAGEFTTWYESGRLASRGTWKAGKRDGRFDYRLENGAVDDSLTGDYAGDRKIGD